LYGCGHAGRDDGMRPRFFRLDLAASSEAGDGFAPRQGVQVPLPMVLETTSDAHVEAPPVKTDTSAVETLTVHIVGADGTGRSGCAPRPNQDERGRCGNAVATVEHQDRASRQALTEKSSLVAP
jgi:hypothetical protein